MVDERIADTVYARLRTDIVRGVLRPNEPLVEDEIAERLTVSRTPVRESLHRLATDGLIVSRRRRWLVYEHGPEEIREIYETRAALEGYAARLACERADDAQLAAIAAARERIAAPASGDDGVRLNEYFHDLIVDAARNTRLARLIRQGRVYFFNYRIATLYTADEVAEYARQHLGLIDAVCARDAAAAEALTREHVAHALHLIITKLH